MTYSKIRKMLIPVAMLCALASCKSISSEARAEQQALEPLYSAALSVDAITVSVKSYGCTSEQDFIVVMDTTEGVNRLSVVRTKKDRCRRMPKVVELNLSMEALQIEPDQVIKLLNPIVAQTGG